MRSFANASGDCRRCPHNYNGLLMIFLSRMLAITRGHRALLSVAVAGSILFTALSVLPALIIRQMLTVLTPGHLAASTTLVLLGMAVVAVTALMAVMLSVFSG